MRSVRLAGLPVRRSKESSMSRHSARSIQLTASLAAVGLVFLGCGRGAGSSAPTNPASAPAGSPGGAAPNAATAGGAPGQVVSASPQLIPAKIAYTTIAASQAPIWLADAAGYFTEQGLDVGDMNRVDPGATLLAALHNGDLDVAAAGGTSLMLGNLQGLETMIVGSSLDVFEDAIVADPYLTSVEGLRGKTVGVSRLKAISDTAARVGLEKLGLKPDEDVSFRGTGGNAESLAALQQDSVDAASLSVPALFKAESLGFPVLVDITAMHIPYATGTYGATKATIASRPEVIERVLKAVAQGTARFKSDPEYTAQVVKQYTQIQDPTALTKTVEVYRPIFQEDLYPNLEAVQALLDNEEHPAARTAAVTDIVDYQFVDKMRQSGFSSNIPK
jgi:NitT/TauT family transport system substrate-binding protein